MSRLRRSLTAVLPALLIPALVACGGGEAKPGYGDETVQGFDGVEVTGEFGEAPKLEWKNVVAYPDEIQKRTLIEGDGQEIGEGDPVQGTYYVGNGTTLEKEWVYTSGGEGQSSTFSTADGRVFEEALDGAQVGDRIEVIAPSVDLVGEYGNPQFGIGTRDALVIVIDVEGNAAPTDASADELPKVQVDGKDAPTGLDFSGLKKPATDGPLLRHVLEEGDGEEVTSDMTVSVRYFGTTYGAKKPFDSNWTAEGYSTPLANVVPGWTYGLSGVKVGSRVLLQIPPDLAYGEQARPKIPANSTLWFVVEILSAQEGQAQ